MADLRNKPLAEWNISDLKQVVDEQWAEDYSFEIKSTLQTNKDSKGWVTSGKLHSSERDGLAREIVAFANSRGGLLIVGIEESDDHPKRAKALGAPLQQIYQLRDQLSRAISAVVDPPIRGIRLEAIEATEGAGYLVVYIPKSSIAPHGVGQPPQCYLRAGDETKPMTMNDIQSTFWESRSRFERIEILRNEKSSDLRDLSKRQAAVAYRLSAIPHDELPIQGLHRRISNGQFLPTGNQYAERSAASAAPWPFNDRQWSVDANCVRRNFNRPGPPFERGYWEIDQSGAVSIVAEVNGISMEEGEVQVWIAWIRTTLADLLALAKVVANEFGLPDSKWWVDGEAISTASSNRIYYDKNRAERVGLSQRKHFRPVSLAISNDVLGIETLDDSLCSMFCVPCLRPGVDIRKDFLANLADLKIA